ncbi:NUDIX hydrolase [Methylobacterium ajmalii]|uniref:NUDIX hydrolase n=1 Tax=Methylobacterium ajmalii TaxID=2738439 RepID=A0ABV0A5S3_9HYPH|nr:NUDIX hydrolase [uncultured Methylobacterium sp.]
MTPQITKVRVRAVGIVKKGNSILIIKQTDGTTEWNCYPGGKLEHNENLEDCLIRELSEELSLDVSVVQFVGIGTYVEGNKTTLEAFFICEPKSETLRINEKHIIDARFIDLKDLHAHQVYPLELTSDLEKFVTECDSNLVNIGRYYGQFS